MKRVILSCCSIAVLFASCKKNDNNSSQNRSDILSTGKWRLTASTYQRALDGIKDPPEDRYSVLPDCEKDDYMIFSTTKYMIIDKGAIKCNASEPQQTTPGKWTLMNNDAKLRQENPMYTIDWDIDQLDANILKLSHTITEMRNGVTYEFNSTESYIHLN